MPNSSQSSRAPDLGMPQLRPVASPVDTYARPQAEQPSSLLGDLAKSLTMINPALARFGDNQAEAHRQDMQVAAERTFGGLTLAQRNELIARDELPELKDPIYRAAVQNLHGQTYALNEWRADTDRALREEFDRNKGDINGFLADRVQRGAQALGDDPNAQAAFIRATRGITPAWVTQQMTYADRAARQTRDEGITTVFTETISKGVEAGRPPAEILAQIKAQYAGNTELARVTPAEQRALLFTSLQALSNRPGYADTIQHILFDKTDGGEAIGDTTEFAGRAFGLVRQARAVTDSEGQRQRSDAWVDIQSRVNAVTATEADIQHEVDMRTISPEVGNQLKVELRSRIEAKTRADEAALQTEKDRVHDEAARKQVIMDVARAAAVGKAVEGIPRSYMKADGTLVNISPEEARDEVIRDQWRYWETQVALGKTTREKADQEFGNMLHLNGWVNPVWKRDLGVMPFIDLADASAPELSVDLKRRIDLYRRIKANTPFAMEKYVPDADAARFYSTFTTLTDYLGKTEPEAMQMTYRIMQRLQTPEGRMTAETNRRKLEDAAAHVGFRDTNFWTKHAPAFLGGQDVPHNIGDVQRSMAMIANQYLASGVGTEQAFELAAKDFARTHVMINGWATFLPPQRNVPANFKELAQEFVKRWSKANGAMLKSNGYDPDELTIVPMSEGSSDVWRIAQGVNSFPVHMPGAVFTLDTLAGMQATLDHEAALKVTDAGKTITKLRDYKVGDDQRAAARKFFMETVPDYAGSGLNMTFREGPMAFFEGLGRMIDQSSASATGRDQIAKRRRQMFERARGRMIMDPSSVPAADATDGEWEKWLNG